MREEENERGENERRARGEKGRMRVEGKVKHATLL